MTPFKLALWITKFVASLVLLLIIPGAVWLFVRMTHPAHQYVMQIIDTPQDNGTIVHDYARVDLTDGTMCSLREAFWLNGAFVNPCKVNKVSQ